MQLWLVAAFASALFAGIVSLQGRHCLRQSPFGMLDTGIFLRSQYATTARCSSASLISAASLMAQWYDRRHASVSGHEKAPPERGLAAILSCSAGISPRQPRLT